jgi:hypothetical protein
MPEPSLAKELSSGLGSVFERIGEFFHIFDLSFFVAGVSTFGALVFAYAQFVYFRQAMPKVFPLDSWMWAVGSVVASYICGLVSFAGGRLVSETIFGYFLRKRILLRDLLPAIADHDLENHPKLTKYVAAAKPKNGGCDAQKEIADRQILSRLYIRMWSEVAHTNDAPLFWHHLTRYWAMTATYDAVAFSLLIWTASLLFVACSIGMDKIEFVPCVAGSVLTFGAAFISFMRGTKYYAYQVEDLVAHFASTWRKEDVKILE